MSPDDHLPEWAEAAAQFLANNIPKDDERSGWDHAFSSAWQMGCMGLAKLGYASETRWGAIPLEPPLVPEIMPRWDDICVSVLNLAHQRYLLSYRLPDGSKPPEPDVIGWIVRYPNNSVPRTPFPNIRASHGLGPAYCEPYALKVLEIIGLVSEGAWTEQSEFLLWRTCPRNWKLDFESDERFLNACEHAVRTLPEDIARELADLMVITDDEVADYIACKASYLAELQEEFGPREEFEGVLSKDEARRYLESSRPDKLDWLFFRRWRMDDGWLTENQAKAALDIFHDVLAVAMRKAVIKRLYPSKTQFFTGR